jgi:hypothetical protein
VECAETDCEYLEQYEGHGNHRSDADYLGLTKNPLPPPSQLCALGAGLEEIKTKKLMSIIQIENLKTAATFGKKLIRGITAASADAYAMASVRGHY